MSAPLVVNTRDGVCWTRRAVTSGGIALYAPEGIRTCPEFVMATLEELAEQGIVGSADALPMPVAPEPQDAGARAKIAELIGDAKPAADGLLERLAESVRDRREHEHPTWEDLFCLNLVSWAGERMGPVLRRLLDAEARAERYRIAWGMARARAISAGGAADRYAARSRDAQDALQHMLFTVIAGQMALHEANRERQELRARVAELEAAAKEIQRLHTDSPMGPCPVCINADAGPDEDPTVPYPCPTARLAGAKDCDPPSYVSRPLPPRDAVCARPGCGHPGVEHHHGDTRCWARLPKPLGAPVTNCGCTSFVAEDDVTPQVAKLRALLAGQATDGSEFFEPGHAYTHRPGPGDLGGPRLRFYCESVTTDRTTGQPVARGWGGRRYGDRWTSVQQARGLGDWQSGAWVDTTTGGDV